MTGDKTQPQKLLEEIDSTIQHTESEQYPTDPPEVVDAPKFPTIAEQNEYWRKKALMGTPEIDHKALQAADEKANKPPRKWSAARRRKYNAKKADELKRRVQSFPDILEEASLSAIPTIRYCPFCSSSLERFLA